MRVCEGLWRPRCGLLVQQQVVALNDGLGRMNDGRAIPGDIMQTEKVSGGRISDTR